MVIIGIQQEIAAAHFFPCVQISVAKFIPPLLKNQIQPLD
jgi:hypothetical protein